MKNAGGYPSAFFLFSRCSSLSAASPDLQSGGFVLRWALKPLKLNRIYNPMVFTTGFETPAQDIRIINLNEHKNYFFVPMNFIFVN